MNVLTHHLPSQRRWRRTVGSLAVTMLVAACASHAPAPYVERGGSTAVAAAPAPAVVPKDVYVVKKGDTLYGIALDNGLDYRELASWNGIENPNLILVGQQLRVKAPGTADSDVAVAKPVVLTQSVEKRSLDGNSDTLKRGPKGGKEPYSEQALAAAKSTPAATPKTADPAPAAAPAATAVAKAEAKTEAKTEAKPDSKTDAAGPDEISWQWPATGKTIGTFSEAANKGVDIAGKAGDAILAAGDGKVVYSGSGLRGYGKLVIIKHNGTYLSAYAHNRAILVKEGQAVKKGQKIAEMGDSDADQVKLHFEIRRQGKPIDPLKYLPPR
ncbi:peptidoglycan DD-metalloendopeptidase family protein [Rhodocyclus gracilis]|uniref:Peptidoglycan DD-metalloendopeptidase family protein n=1 Tax=Rhodocyclus tenuis TaxID=1066 RepID=A0A6L5JTT1_RHOTE|nr:peptidoglycan DD-metalloendopeptidase family protein [Rhodocyclus gracilis]MQY50232.1 peptidoglycan DD-metalloendopeptidase family protein [Rhodocyclus gracilis]